MASECPNVWQNKCNVWQLSLPLLEAARCSETLVIIYQTTRRHILEDSDLQNLQRIIISK
jgi:hypothetical protein